MRRDGFTLIEVLTASSLLTAALAMIWQAWMMANGTSDAIGRKMDASDAAHGAMNTIARELRQASHASLSPLPAAELRYRIVEDTDGNGLPVDAAGDVELSEVRTITRDTNDANSDGRTIDQLVLISGDRVVVLANGLIADEAEDVNGNGLVDRGVWFEAAPGGVEVRIAVEARTMRVGAMPAAAAQRVSPRNP